MEEVKKCIQRLSLQEDESASVSFTDLPPEVIVIIFSEYIRAEGPKTFLKTVPLVCSRWRNLSFVSSLWDSLSLRSLKSNFEHLLKLGAMGLLASTTYLDLNTSYEKQKNSGYVRRRVKPADFIALAPYCRNIKCLDISYNKLSKDAMQALALNCPNVDQLTMAHITGSNQDFNPRHHSYFRAMSARILDPVFNVWGPKLRHIDLEGCLLDQDNNLIWKLANCPCLERLYLTNTQIVGRKIECWIDQLQKGCPKLQALELYNCDIKWQGERNFDGFKELREFFVTACDFNGLNLSLLLRNAALLEDLQASLQYSEMKNIHLIPTLNLQVLQIVLPDGPIDYVVAAINKWRSSLAVISISSPFGQDLYEVMEVFLENNEHPMLEALYLNNFLMPMTLLKHVIRNCAKLNMLSLRGKEPHYTPKIFSNRQKIEKILLFDDSYFK